MMENLVEIMVVFGLIVLLAFVMLGCEGPASIDGQNYYANNTQRG